jgi:DNA-binding GntR family transcriptional regulator
LACHMGDDFPLESNETQANQAYRILEEMIVTLEIPPGSRISENSISRRLGIGRTPVREAMQRLAREGTLRILSRAGAIVSDIDVTDQFKLIEVRRELERVIAGRAARLADAEAKATFEGLAERFDRAAAQNDYTVFIAADREFNQMMVRTANNSYATVAMAPIQAQTRRFWFLNFQKFGDLKRVCLLHAQIARAVARNDIDGARQASDDLIDYVEEYTRKTLEALL